MARLLFLFISLFPVAASAAVEYSDLEALGIACRPRDTCSNNAVVTKFSSRNCECDSWCHSFDDCCVDAPAARSQSTMNKRFGMTCLPLDYNQGVYAIGNCRSTWNGSDVVRSKCEDMHDFSDPMLSLPSTDTHTKVTYRNYYCAECNSANLSGLSSWDATLTCSQSLVDIDSRFHNITQDVIMEKITQLGNSWGLYQWNESIGDMEFYPCEVSFHLPFHLRPHIRYCRPYVISDCAATWRRNRVRKKCLEYMAVLYFGDVAYRNGHCAVCNHVPVRNPTCSWTVIRANPPVSFTLLMDVNPSDGDTVGEVNRCPSGEKYDPFFKKCRTLVCAIPGYVLRGDRCVRA